MVGAENCSGPTLSSFGTNFGLSPLVGKLAAIIDDARLGSKTDQAQVTERLLTISGEGSLTIDRKHREPVDFKLTARITFISNELPRLADSSTALANRLLLMRCTRSFLGQEDPALEAKLLPELPGILLWAIEGLKRLRDRGRFAQPESGETMLEEMEELASPAGAFVRDCLEEDPESEADVQAVYQAWIAWCEMMGERHPGNQANFGRNLRAFLPTLETKQRRGSGGERHRVFLGVRLARVPSKGYAPLPPSLEPVIHIPDPQQQAIPF
jgi:putative DNA primase/helicase